METSTELADVREHRTDEINEVDMKMEEDEAPIESNVATKKYDESDFKVVDSNSNCKGSNAKNCGKGIFYWYISPLTCDLLYSFRCLLYHWINWFLVLGVFIFMCTMIPLSVGLLVLACVGLVLMYFTFEITLLITRLEFVLAFLFIERNESLKKNEKWKLRLTLDNKNLPVCNECCVRGNRLERQKFLFTNKSIYFLVFFHLILNPFVTFFVSMAGGLIPIYVAYFITFPFFIGFSNRTINLGYWHINGFGDAFGGMIAGILLLPLAFRFCNYCAYLCKIWVYWAFTDYFTMKNHTQNQNTSLLTDRSVNFNTKGLNLNEDNDNGTQV